MIHVDANVNGVDCMLAEFGYGDITPFVGNNSKDGVVSILFKSTTPSQIGEIHSDMENLRSIEDIKPELIFTFSKTESIDVIINSLKLAKKLLEKK